MIPGFHGLDLIVILVVALLIFGPKRLPEMGSAVGKSIKEFRKGMAELTSPKEAKEEEPEPEPPTARVDAIDSEIASKRAQLEAIDREIATRRASSEVSNTETSTHHNPSDTGATTADNVSNTETSAHHSEHYQ